MIEFSTVYQPIPNLSFPDKIKNFFKHLPAHPELCQWHLCGAIRVKTNSSFVLRLRKRIRFSVNWRFNPDRFPKPVRIFGTS